MAGRRWRSLSAAAAIAGLSGLPAWLPPTPVLAETAEETAADCEARLALAPGGCRCIVEDWASFAADERTYVAAIAAGDEAGAAVAEARLSDQQKLHTGFFMANIASKLAC